MIPRQEVLMQRSNNERGSVLVFVTLMMVLLFVMVGLGLDTGHLSYIRSQGQPAVDAAALAAVNALPTLSITEVEQRAGVLNYNSGSNAGGNNYLNSPNNLIGKNNVTLINYDASDPNNPIITKAASIATANGVRVALESTNPYDGAATATPMKAPLFLTPLLNLLGQNTKGTQNVSVSAVAVLTAIPGMPVAIAGCNPSDSTCRYCQPPSAGCESGDGSSSNPYRNCKLLQVSSANNGNGQNVDTPKFQDSGWTTFGTPSANAPSIKALVRNNSTCGNIPPIDMGSGCIYLNNGQITPVLSEFDDAYSKNPSGFAGLWLPAPADPDNHPIPPEDWGVIPVVRNDIGNFNGCEPVKSFAKFGIRGVMKSGNDKWLVGDLICQRKLSELGGTACYTTQLVRDKNSGM
jgi:Flp pilus assembly protein TadG